MQLRYTLFPFGSLEGSPSIALSEPGERWREVDVSSVLGRAWRQGYRSIWIEDAPWGEEEWDRQLHRCMSHVDLQQLEFVALRKVDERFWSPLDLLWVLDASSLLAEPTSVVALRGAIMQLRWRPIPIEIVICNPHPDNITEAILDEVSTQLAPKFGAYMYANDDEKGDEVDRRMRLAFPKVSTFWTMRRITRAHTEMQEESWEP